MPNVELMKKVRKLIADEPLRLNMGGWGMTGLVAGSTCEYDIEVPSCGTVACLAGWTILANQGENPSDWKDVFKEYRHLEFAVNGRPDKIAAKLLGLDRDDCPFLNMHWTADQVIGWLDQQIEKHETPIGA